MPSPITGLQLITDAFLDAGISSPGEVLSAEDSAYGLSKLSRMLDAWNADDLNIYAYDFLEFILLPSIQPLTIGQSAQITSASLTSDVATFIAKNVYKVGDYVDTSGLMPSALNVTNAQVKLASPTQFQLSITTGNISPTSQTGALAVYSGNPAPNYATLGQRPAKIVNANIILNNVNPIVKVPLNVHNNKPGGDWWAANTVPTTATTLPTDLYYSAEWPNGSLYLWPLQNTNYGLELECWNNLSDIPSLSYPFYLPQGYRDAVTLSLAESLWPSYDKPPNIVLVAQAAKARAKIQAMNSQSLTIMTSDQGIPRGARRGSMFNYLSGQVVPGRGQ